MEACDELWSPRSNATALAGFALTTTTTMLRGYAVVCRPSVCPSVFLSATFRYVCCFRQVGILRIYFHGWLQWFNLRFLLWLRITWAIWSNENVPKLEWNKGGVMNKKTCDISETGQGYSDGLIRSRKRAFDWYQNRWTWMTLSDRNALLQKTKRFSITMAQCLCWYSSLQALIIVFVHYSDRQNN